ncbi:DUF1345 domain-containing protein [Micromonospora ureilytica]|uniref:DUF1345 domain-containing protein n=1 Tax=Micromonospora ureilytica TaxID=709868 RepID=UPI0033D58DFE
MSVAFTVLVGAGYGFFTQVGNPELVGSLQFVAIIYFGSWALYSGTYVALTWLALRGADGATLREWLTENRAGRERRRATERLTGSGGPLGAVTFCAVAIGAVVAAAVRPELRENPVVVVLAVVVVVTTWTLIAVVFAVHYAREDAQDAGFAFPGTDPQNPPGLSDYWYLAVQVSTAYNSADVTVTTRHLRTAVSAHAVVAFVFNTVLIALLVSLLIIVTT